MDTRRLVSENGLVKLVSLILSLSLWLYVTATGKTELTLSVPLELRNVPQGMTVVGDVAGRIEVRMQGRERLLRDGAVTRRIVALVDLSGAKEGGNEIMISPDDIRRPAGITVSHLSQSVITVHLERVVRKTFRVTPVLRGSPAPGYRLAGATVVPARIIIEGPASVMQTLDRIVTMPIDIRKATASMTVEPRIDYQGKPVKLIDRNIEVHVDIERTAR